MHFGHDIGASFFSDDRDVKAIANCGIRKQLPCQSASRHDTRVLLPISPRVQRAKQLTHGTRPAGMTPHRSLPLIHRWQSLPASMGNMGSVQVLNCRCNHLRHLPPEMGRLTSLQSLDVSGNRSAPRPPPRPPPHAAPRPPCIAVATTSARSRRAGCPVCGPATCATLKPPRRLSPFVLLPRGHAAAGPPLLFADPSRYSSR